MSSGWSWCCWSPGEYTQGPIFHIALHRRGEIKSTWNSVRSKERDLHNMLQNKVAIKLTQRFVERGAAPFLCEREIWRKSVIRTSAWELACFIFAVQTPVHLQPAFKQTHTHANTGKLDGKSCLGPTHADKVQSEIIITWWRKYICVSVMRRHQTRKKKTNVFV